MTNEEFIEKNAKMVYRIALSQTGSRDDAEEVFQEVFIELARRTDCLESQEAAERWLMGRTIACSKSHSLSPWMKRLTALPVRMPNRAARREKGAFELVTELPAKYKSVIYLHYYEGYGINEIAAILHVRPEKVKDRLTRARGLLEEQLPERNLKEYRDVLNAAEPSEELVKKW